MTPDKDLFLMAIGGDGMFRFWKQPEPDKEGVDCGWRMYREEATLMTRAEALEVVGKLGNVVVGLVVQYPKQCHDNLRGATPDASTGPAESACSGSFCEIAAIHDKGGAQ